MALGLVLEEIKTDLALSDTELGLLTGIAFALFYAVLGIPIAHWADRGNRVAIIAFTTAVWSIAVALCGAARTFVQLVLIRVAVGAGEAGCMPPAHSLIAEHFSRAERPRAAAIYTLGAPLSMVIGYFLAGWLNELYGWRVTFVVLGLPGLLWAAIAGLTLKEARRQLPRKKSALADAPTLKEVCLNLGRIHTFRHLLIGFSVLNFFLYGILQWQPTFFVRSHGLHTAELGMWFALIYGAIGVLGTYLGGEWAVRYPKREGLHLKAVSAFYLGMAVLSPWVYLAATPQRAFAVLACTSFAYFATFGPSVATIQTLVPQRMRATAFALIYLFTNLIGNGLGPLAVGALSDAFKPWAGQDSLRYSLLAFSPGYLWVAWHMWWAGKTVARDVERTQAFESIEGEPRASGTRPILTHS